MSFQFTSAQLDRMAELRLEDHLRSFIVEGSQDRQATYAELTSPEGAAEIRRQVARARSYGFTAELDLARYVISAWLLGVDFDTRLPAMAQILADTRLTPAQRAEAIQQVTTTLLATLYGAKPQ